MTAYRFAVAAFLAAVLSLSAMTGVVLAGALDVGPWEPRPVAEMLRADFPGNVGDA
jgi:hypothetical protein